MFSRARALKAWAATDSMRRQQEMMNDPKSFDKENSSIYDEIPQVHLLLF